MIRGAFGDTLIGVWLFWLTSVNWEYGLFMDLPSRNALHGDVKVLAIVIYGTSVAQAQGVLTEFATGNLQTVALHMREGAYRILSVEKVSVVGCYPRLTAGNLDDDGFFRLQNNGGVVDFHFVAFLAGGENENKRSKSNRN